MAKKGLDTTFVHYGICKEDMSLIEFLCTEHKLSVEWSSLSTYLQLRRQMYSQVTSGIYLFPKRGAECVSFGVAFQYANA